MQLTLEILSLGKLQSEKACQVGISGDIQKLLSMVHTNTKTLVKGGCRWSEKAQGGGRR